MIRIACALALCTVLAACSTGSTAWSEAETEAIADRLAALDLRTKLRQWQPNGPTADSNRSPFVRELHPKDTPATSDGRRFFLIYAGPRSFFVRESAGIQPRSVLYGPFDLDLLDQE
jgi:hypothetical protein